MKKSSSRTRNKIFSVLKLFFFLYFCYTQIWVEWYFILFVHCMHWICVKCESDRENQRVSGNNSRFFPLFPWWFPLGSFLDNKIPQMQRTYKTVLVWSICTRWLTLFLIIDYYYIKWTVIYAFLFKNPFRVIYFKCRNHSARSGWESVMELTQPNNKAK